MSRGAFTPAQAISVPSLTALNTITLADVPVGTVATLLSTGATYVIGTDGTWAAVSGEGGGTITSVVGTAGQVGADTVAGVVTLTNLAAFTADTTIQLNNTTPAAVNAFRSVVALTSGTPAAERSSYTVTLLTAGAATQGLYVRGDGRCVIGAPGAALDAGANSITCIGAVSVASTLSLGITTATASAVPLGAIVFYNGVNPTAIITASTASSTTGGDITFQCGLAGATISTWTTSGLTMANAKTLTMTSGNIIMSGANISITGASNQGINRTGGPLLIWTTDASKTLIGANQVVGITLGTAGNTIGFLAVANAGNAVAAQTVDAVTNSVTSGGTSGTIADYSSLTVYSTDAAAIRNNIYQLARSVAQIATGLRAYGLGV